MSAQEALFDVPIRPSDIVFTPENIAKDIISWLNPSGLCLDPCKGDGAFYDNMPIGSQYCEINEGSDFLKYQNKVNWIIGNPPYSIFEEFLQHSFLLADNVAYLVPTNKIFQRQLIMDRIMKWGGIKGMLIYGSGQLLEFPFGFSVGLFHFKKNYSGTTAIHMGMRSIEKLNASLRKRK